MRTTLIAFLFVTCTHAQAPNDSLVKSAQQRQESYRKVAVTFTLKEVVAVGAISEAELLMQRGKAIPERETVLESTNLLALDGDKVRLERNHPGFAAPDGTIIQQRMEAFYDGELTQMHYPSGISSTGKGEGIIQSSSAQQAIREDLFMPLVLFLRGNDRALSPYRLALFKPTGTTLTIGKTMCAEYNFAPRSGSIISAWVDPKAEHVIRRLQFQTAGKLTRQIDMSYTTDTQQRPRLERWTATRFNSGGKVARSVQGEVTKYDQPEQFATSYFQPKYAPDTIVTDERTDKHYRVESDGLMRELSRTGESLSATTFQPGTTWLRRNRWLLIACVLVVLVGVGTVVKRRRRTA